MFWCPYMVSVQCDGGLLPDIILLTLCDSIGEPFECHVEFSSLQPLFPPKPFDLLEGLDVFRFFFKQERCKDEKLQSKFACADQPSAPGCCTVCVCVFSSHSFWTSMDVPAGVTQEEGHTGFFIHLLPAVRALIFLARRIQPFLSLVDREVEFCVLTM